MQVSLFNVKKNGKYDYLSIGEDMLPTVYMVTRFPSCPVAVHTALLTKCSSC